MKPAGIDQNLSIDDSLLIRIENGASLTYYFWVNFDNVNGKNDSNTYDCDFPKIPIGMTLIAHLWWAPFCLVVAITTVVIRLMP